VKIPYAETEIPATRTQGEIIGLLYTAGAETTRWTSTREGAMELEFVFPVEGQKIAFRIRTPLIKDSLGRGKPDQTARLLWWWLKSQLEAIRYGLVSTEEAFLAHAVANLKGQTVGQILLPRIREGFGVLPVLPEGPE
jgi:hypothetical protein